MSAFLLSMYRRSILVRTRACQQLKYVLAKIIYGEYACGMKIHSERREFRLSPEDVDRLDELMTETGLSRSEVIRAAIKKWHTSAKIDRSYLAQEGQQLTRMEDGTYKPIERVDIIV